MTRSKCQVLICSERVYQLMCDSTHSKRDETQGSKAGGGLTAWRNPANAASTLLTDAAAFTH